LTFSAPIKLPANSMPQQDYLREALADSEDFDASDPLSVAAARGRQSAYATYFDPKRTPAPTATPDYRRMMMTRQNLVAAEKLYGDQLRDFDRNEGAALRTPPDLTSGRPIRDSARKYLTPEEEQAHQRIGDFLQGAGMGLKPHTDPLTGKRTMPGGLTPEVRERVKNNLTVMNVDTAAPIGGISDAERTALERIQRTNLAPLESERDQLRTAAQDAQNRHLAPLRQKRAWLQNQADAVARARQDFDQNVYLPTRTQVADSLTGGYPQTASAQSGAGGAAGQPADYLAPEGLDWASQRIREVQMKRQRAGQPPIQPGTMGPRGATWTPIQGGGVPDTAVGADDAPEGLDSQQTTPETAPGESIPESLNDVNPPGGAAPDERDTGTAGAPLQSDEEIRALLPESQRATQTPLPPEGAPTPQQKWKESGPLGRLGMLAEKYVERSPVALDQIQQTYESQQAPTVRIPNIPADATDDMIVDARTGLSLGHVKGAINAVADFASGLTSKFNLGTLGAIGVLGKAAQVVGPIGTAAQKALAGVETAFGAQMAKGAGERAGELSVTLGRPETSNEEVARGLVGLGLDAGMAGMISKSAFGNLRPKGRAGAPIPPEEPGSENATRGEPPPPDDTGRPSADEPLPPKPPITGVPGEAPTPPAQGASVRLSRAGHDWERQEDGSWVSTRAGGEITAPADSPTARSLEKQLQPEPTAPETAPAPTAGATPHGPQTQPDKEKALGAQPEEAAAAPRLQVTVQRPQQPGDPGFVQVDRLGPDGEGLGSMEFRDSGLPPLPEDLPTGKYFYDEATGRYEPAEASAPTSTGEPTNAADQIVEQTGSRNELPRNPQRAELPEVGAPLREGEGRPDGGGGGDERGAQPNEVQGQAEGQGPRQGRDDGQGYGRGDVAPVEPVEGAPITRGELLKRRNDLAALRSLRAPGTRDFELLSNEIGRLEDAVAAMPRETTEGDASSTAGGETAPAATPEVADATQKVARPEEAKLSNETTPETLEPVPAGNEASPERQLGGVLPKEPAQTREQVADAAREKGNSDSSLPPVPPDAYETLLALQNKANRSGYNPDVLTPGRLAAAAEQGLVTKTKNPKLTEAGRNRLMNWGQMARDRSLKAASLSDQLVDDAVSKWDRENDPNSWEGKNAAKAAAKPAVDRAIAALEDLKLNKPGRVSAATPFSLAWDGALETAIVGLRAGRAVANAVADATDHFRKRFPGATPAQVARLQAAIQRQAAAGVSPARSALSTARQKIADMAGSGEVRKTMAYTRDVADNEAGVYGRERATTINNAIDDAFGIRKLPAIRRSAVRAKAQEALTFAVEAGGDITRLDEFERLISESTKPVKRATEALAAIDFARQHAKELAPIVDRYNELTAEQRNAERAAGFDTLEYPNYVMHAQEIDDGAAAGLFSASSGDGGGAGFRKVREFPTLADSIAAGINPKNINAVDLLQTRTTRGQQMINRKAWFEGLRNLTDPTTKTPIVIDAPVTMRADKSTYIDPPKGYTQERMAGVPFAIRKGYEGTFQALTDPSWWGKSPERAALQKANSLGKTAALAIDTYHLGRLAAWNAVTRLNALGLLGGGVKLPKAWSYRRGLTLLDQTPAEIIRTGQQSGLNNAEIRLRLDQKAKLGLALKTGANFGRVEDALYQDWIRKVPGIGHLNKFIFDDFQRGAMAEIWLMEFNRQRGMSGNRALADAEVARNVSKDVNTRFGNLGRQGWMRSRTLQDIARMMILAPQWNEGLIRSEFGAGKQGLQAAWKAGTGQGLATGMLARSVATMVIGQFVANQIINQYTRHQWTWENPEEGLGAKLSAWIPDKIGSGPGFFLHPMGIGAEVIHLLSKAYERTGDWFKAVDQFTRGRQSFLGRAGWTFLTDTDPFGRPTGGHRVKESLRALDPIPFAARGIDPLQRNLSVGQTQRQLMQSVGVKTDQAPSAEQRIQALAQEFKRAKPGFKPEVPNPMGDYAEVTAAIRLGDEDAAIAQIVKLLDSKSAEQIQRAFIRSRNSRFTGTIAGENEFHRNLTPEQRRTYSQAVNERQKNAQTALRLLDQARRIHAQQMHGTAAR
jgi:hypothetical protein